MNSIIALCALLASLSHPEPLLKPQNAPLMDVEITVKNIRNNKGKISIGFFKDQLSFDKEKPFKSVPCLKQSVSNGILKVKVQLEPGSYGASLLDDENDNGKMDYNVLGIPKEGFGFSNYYHTGFSKPKMQAFQFEVKAEPTPKIEMVIRYL
jgi:uncharacterized protein (DUF2141 family)